MRKRFPPPPEPVFDCDQLEDAPLAWRTAQYLQLGYTVADSAALAEALIDGEPLDWHRAAALVLAGCPLDLVKAILL